MRYHVHLCQLKFLLFGRNAHRLRELLEHVLDYREHVVEILSHDNE
jgi:hypothetical protein